MQISLKTFMLYMFSTWNIPNGKNIYHHLVSSSKCVNLTEFLSKCILYTCIQINLKHSNHAFNLKVCYTLGITFKTENVIYAAKIICVILSNN